MNNKRCLVCRTVLNGDANCPVCDFPDYINLNNKPEVIRKVQELAENFREEKLKNIKISIHAYAYEMREGKLTEKSVETIPVCDAKTLSFEKIFWLEKKFAGIETEREMNLTVVITNDEQVIIQKDVFFKAPNLDEFWYLGAGLTEGLGIEFFIGNQENYVKTGSVSLI